MTNIGDCLAALEQRLASTPRSESRAVIQRAMASLSNGDLALLASLARGMMGPQDDGGRRVRLVKAA
jgi:hypothetical protein